MKLHIGYLRSLVDDARARAACVTYLQNWMINFYPDRLDLFEQANELAETSAGNCRFRDYPGSTHGREFRTVFGEARAS